MSDISIRPAKPEDFRDLAEWIASLGEPGAKDFTEQLHPRDSHGRFAEVAGEAPFDTPTNLGDLFDTFTRGVERYRSLLAAHGGPPEDSFPLSPEDFYAKMNVDEAKPEDVTPKQRAVCEQAAAEFLAEPRLQPIFDAYGEPEIVAASRLIGSDDLVGDDPRDRGVMAQYSGGTIFLYGGVAGDPEFATKLVDASPGVSVGGGDLPPTMLHEYGHHVMGVIGYDEFGDDSAFAESFKDAILGDGTEETIAMNTSQLSDYAGYSVGEAFAEAFTTVMDPEFDIDDYDGGMRDALQLIVDQIEQDTPDPNQGRLFG
jgi:hypothetical protein